MTSGLRVSAVDPRDIEWEEGHPTFRIYFWSAEGSSDEYELSGASVTQALECAVGNATGRTWDLWVRVDDGRRGLIWLQRGSGPETIGLRQPPGR
jgi:hypothetical protein